MSELISGTRVPKEKAKLVYETTLTKFIDTTSVFGQALIVSQNAYTDLVNLTDYVKEQRGSGKNVEMVLSDSTGNSPATMCNMIVRACQERNLSYFAIISGDLVDSIPVVLPEMLDRMKSSSTLAMLGVAIQGVHNFGLIHSVEEHGKDQIGVLNFATAFVNNAFALYRLPIDGVNFETRLFPTVADGGQLGTVEVMGEQTKVDGNEEIAVVLNALAQGISLNAGLLVTEAVKRDIDKEMSNKPIPFKVARRPAVAHRYQEFFNISNEKLSDWLKNHFEFII